MPAEPLTYLDHAATTPVRPAAVKAMLPFLTQHFGNPSGSHAAARRARRAIDDARDTMAQALGCQPGEVVFTGGGTEANNTAIAGVLARRPGVAVCSASEHHAVLHPVEAAGGRTVPVDARGVIDLDALAQALAEVRPAGVAVVSVMLVNNEVGTVQPLADVAEVVHEVAPEAVLHTDAVQGFLWLDVAVLAADAPLISVSAHKFGGPQGVGALVVRAGTPLAPLLTGGGQERDRRSGTQNVAGIVGMASAAQAVVDERTALVARVGALRDRLVDGLRAVVPGTFETGDRSVKVAGSAHVCFDGIESEALLFLLDQAGLCATAASSCASGALDPSHVLAAMGVPRSQAAGSLRLSLGWSSTDAEVDRALEIVPTAIERLRLAAA